MDWLFDTDDAEAANADGDWVQVEKKGKKTKNGVKSSKYSLQKELLDATGQESWWTEPSLATSSHQVDEIDSLPLRPSKASTQFDQYIESLNRVGHQGSTLSHIAPDRPRSGGSAQGGLPHSNNELPTSSHQRLHMAPGVGGNSQTRVENRGLPPSMPLPGGIRPVVSQPGHPGYQQPVHQLRTSASGRPPIGQPSPNSQQNSRAIVQSSASHRAIGNPAPQPNPKSPGIAPQQGFPQPRPPNPVPVPPSVRHWLESYEFKLACTLCFIKKPDKYGVDAFHFHHWPNHKCNGDTLVCRLRSSSGASQHWGIIRPIANMNFMGTFRRCSQFQNGVSCRVSHMNCHFAHSDEEMELWDAQRSGDFDRDALLSYLHKSSQAQRRGYRQAPPTVSQNSPQQRNSGQVPQQAPGIPSQRVPNVNPIPKRATNIPGQNHPYPLGPNINQSLQHPPNGPIQKHPYQGVPNVNQNPQHPPNSPIQKHPYQGVPNVNQNPQHPPNSPIQKYPYQGVPNVNREPQYPPNSPSPKYPYQVGPNVNQAPQQAPSSPIRKFPYQGAPSAGQSAFQTTNGHVRSTPRLDDTTHERIPAFQHPLRIVCRECFESGRHSFASDDHNGCGSPGRHIWEETVVVVSSASGHWEKVAPRPVGLAPYVKVRLCKSGSGCTYEQFSGVPCSYAHSQEEIELWTYQGHHDLKTIEEVILVGQRSHAPETVSLESFIPIGVTKRLNSKSRWKHRDPPFVRSGNFKRCWHDRNNRCQYSQATPNFCRFAHSDAELEEWKQRHQLERQQRQMAPPAPKITADMLHGDTARGPLATDPPGPNLASQSRTPSYNNEAPPIVINPMAGLTPTDVERLKVVMPVQADLLNARYTYKWRFAIHPKNVPGVNQVCFLNGSHQQHFKMSWSKSANGMLVDVTFDSPVTGFFQQPVFFDFAPQQSFRIFLTLFVGGELPLDEDSANQEGEKDMDRFPWNSVNSEIVPYSGRRAQDPLYERLMRDYPPPPDKPVVFKEGEGFFEDSFKVYLHKLIQLEEKGCNEKISKYFGLHEMTLINDIREIGAYTRAPTGELFGKIMVEKQLMDNSDASQIVANSVNFVLLKFQSSSKVVYQAEIFKEGAVYQSDEIIYVKIGRQCVERERLEADSQLTVQLQFQLNRVTFCLLHYGVDHFNVPEIAFPQRDHGPRFLSVKKAELEGMNPRQESAARYIVGAGRDRIFYPGPTLIIGPYGTGKTHTLAKIVMRLLESPESCKVLIAAHTNSAADWYITEYLHPFLKLRRKNNRSYLVRVYAHDIVALNRINPAILENYVLSEGDQQPVEQLRKPTLADIHRCRVVVTTLTSSIHLVEMSELRGQFSHIFIDEAGQALEPEAMIPLGLAGPRTVVALAGDHKQMRPKVHTKECHERLLHRSMLERLNTASRIMKFHNTCLLSFNYRLRPEILNFITKFYDGDPLTPRGKHLRHPDYYPLTFMEVKGLDQKRGASYVNAIEAQSLVSAIQSLVNSWPTQKWGNFDAKSISVLAPYTLQVKHLRTLLRAKQLGGVTVERVQNVQGKQFKVVFLSTVRTRHTLKPGEEQEKGEENFYHGFLSDEGEIIAACTRAQSLLYVVGDPVALCSVGECQRVWRTYLQECEDNGSLLPEGATMSKICSEIQELCEPSNDGATSRAAENSRQFNPYRV